MKKLKVAVIGIGHLGSRHLKVYHELSPLVELVSVCDLKSERTMKLADHYKVAFTDDYRSLAGKIDAVNVCVPTESHYEIADFFLSQGVHTFIEKPITPTVKEADALIDLAQKKNLVLQVGHIERFNSAFQSIMHFKEKPLFIECHRLNQFPHRSLDIGVVMDLMIHDIDIILGLLQEPITNIHAIGVNALTPMEDIASVRITFQGGCVCNLTASRISEDVMRKIRIFQKDAYISLDYIQQEAYIYKKADNQILKHALPIEKQEPLKKELSHFIDCIHNHQKPLVSGQEAKEALSVALQISAQIKNHLANIKT
jgi:predicted dehydrogenase